MIQALPILLKKIWNDFRGVLAIIVFALFTAVADGGYAQQAETTWSHFCKTDEMTDKKWCRAFSPTVTKGVASSFLAYECEEGGTVGFPFARFSYLNLAGGNIHEYGENHSILTRWGNNPAEYMNYTATDDGTLFWRDDSTAVRMVGFLIGEEQLRLRLDYYSEGPTVFRYALTGSQASINAVRTGCGLRNFDELESDLWNPEKKLNITCQSGTCVVEQELTREQGLLGEWSSSTVYRCYGYPQKGGVWVLDREKFATERHAEVFSNHPKVAEAKQRCGAKN